MTTVFAAPNDDENRLVFLHELQQITNKIHSTSDIDDILLDLSQDIRDLFGCDRLTIYTVSEDRTKIETRVKTDMQKFKDFSLPITSISIAGHCALTKKLINLRNVYDATELKSHSPDLQFLDKVDRRTHYRTQEMLAAPLVNAENGELLGVLQLINNRRGGPFSKELEGGAKDLCKTLAAAFAQQPKGPVAIKSKYDPLVADSILSLAEMGLAVRSARRKGLDLEDVLVDEFQVGLGDIGYALSKFFGVPYEPYREGRGRPAELPKSLKREYVESHRWLPLGESGGELAVLCTDPEGLKASRIVQDIFPERALTYWVTTNREFRQTVDQFFGSSEQSAAEPRPVMGRKMSKQDLIDQAHALITDALRSLDGSAVEVLVQPGADNVVTAESADGTLASVRGRIVIDFRIAR